MGFLRRYLVLIALAAIVGVFLMLVGQIYLLREALRNERVDRDIMKASLEALKTSKPVIVPITVPGGGVPDINVTVRPPEVSIPGEKPKISVEAPRVPCKTEEECKRIFGAAEQSISVNAALKVGTVVSVCLVDLVNGVCPEGQLANRPLAKAFSFRIDAVRLTGGAYAALEPQFGPITITNVVTLTRPIEIRVAAPSLPYNLGFAAIRMIVPIRDFSRTSAFTGAVYQNRIWSGIYEVGFGYGWPGRALYTGFTIPIR